MPTPLFQKARDACYKKNCAAITKRKGKIDKKTKKLTKKRCAKYDNETSSVKDFFNCTQKVEKETGYTQWFKDMVECNKKYCAKEQEDFLNAFSTKGGNKISIENLREQLNTCKDKKCKKEYTLTAELSKNYSNLRKACKKDNECIHKIYFDRELNKKLGTAHRNANECADKFCEKERKAYGDAFLKENKIVPMNKFDQVKLVIKALFKKGGTKKVRNK
jgi:hypothetical protein